MLPSASVQITRRGVHSHSIITMSQSDHDKAVCIYLLFIFHYIYDTACVDSGDITICGNRLSLAVQCWYTSTVVAVWACPHPLCCSRLGAGGHFCFSSGCGPWTFGTTVVAVLLAALRAVSSLTKCTNIL